MSILKKLSLCGLLLLLMAGNVFAVDPVANDQSVTTAEDTAKAITLTATDGDVGDTLTYSVLGTPNHGTLSGTAPALTYTPIANWYGNDSFTFTANDGSADSNVATVSITVTAVNDAPVANGQSVSTLEDTAKTITLTATDVEGTPLTYLVLTNPSHGVLSGTVPNLTYTPAPNWNGNDSFTFKVDDGTAGSNIALVSIAVSAVNDPPVAGNDFYSTPWPETLTVSALAGVLNNDSDPVEGGPLTAILVTDVSNGLLTLNSDGSFTYTPVKGLGIRSDSFTYLARDGSASSAPVTVTITIDKPNELSWSYGTGSFLGPFSESLITTPAVAPDGTVYFGSDDGSFYAITPDTDADGFGELKWVYSTMGAIVGTPAVTADGAVYFVSNDKNLYSLTADGDRRWVYPLVFSAWVNPGGLALGPDDDLYVAGTNLQKFDRNTGVLLWTRAIPGGISNGPVINTNGQIHVTSGGNLYAYDANGNNVWTFSDTGSILSLSVTDHDNLLVGTSENRLVCVTPEGVLLWTFYTSAPVDSTAVTGADGTIYVGADDGKLYAINQNGARVWEYLTEPALPIKGAPALGSDDKIYFFTQGTAPAIYGNDGIPLWSGAGIYAVDTAGIELPGFPLEPVGYFGHNSPVLSNSGLLYSAITEPQKRVGSIQSAIGYLLGVDVDSPEAATSSWPLFGRDRFNSFNAKTFPPVVPPASLSVPATDTAGSYTVSWTASQTPAPVTYVLEESLDPMFTNVALVTERYRGPLLTFNFIGKSPEVYYYRVKATKADYTDSSWVIGARGCRVGGATLAVPALPFSIPSTDADGAYTISWGASSSPEVTYVLEESRDPNFISGVTAAYRGTATSVDLTNRPSATYFYRVKATKQDYPDTAWRIGPNSCTVPQIPSNLRWSYAAGAGTTDVTNPALALDGTLYFGSNDNYFYALNPTTGVQKWKFLTGGTIVGTPIWSDNVAVGSNADDTIYFVSNDGNLYARNAVTGAHRWIVPLQFTSWTNPGGLALGSDGDIYVAANNLSKYSAAGTLLWASEIVNDISFGPVIDTDGRVYVSSNSQLFAFDDSGNKLWDYTHTGEINSLSVTDGNKILIGSINNRMTCVSSAGARQWDAFTSAPVYSTAVTATNGTIYFGSDDNRLYAVNQLGAYQWDYLAEGDIEGAPAVGSDGVVYFFVSGTSPKLNAVNGGSGAFLWGRALGGDVTDKSPLLATSASGTLYATFAATSPAAILHAINVSSTAAATSTWPMFGRDRFNSFNAKRYPVVLSPPDIMVPAADEDGSYTIEWFGSSTPAIDEYVVEESTTPEFASPTVVYSGGTNLSKPLVGRAAGTYYYRVKAVKIGYSDSDWSAGINGCVVPVGIPGSLSVPATDPDGSYIISWAASLTAGASYVVEESTDATFVTEVAEIYSGTGLTVALTGRPNGTYYYRVKATKVGYTESEWQTSPANVCVVTGYPGDQVWAYVAGTATTSVTNPALDLDGNIYFGSNDNSFYSIDEFGTQPERWKYLTGGAIVGTPVWSDNGTAATTDDAVYFVSNDKNLYALDNSGTLLWANPLGFTSWLNASGIALGSDGDLYVAAKNVTKVAADGTVLWTSALASEGNTFTYGPVIGENAQVYVASGSNLYALDSAGNTAWTYAHTGAITSISITDDDNLYENIPGNILIGSADNRLTSVSAAGVKLWHFAASGPVNSTAVTGADGTIYFGSDANKLYAVNQNGTPKWEYVSTTGAVKGAPAIGNDGVVYFFTSGSPDRINALNSTGTELRWSRTVTGELDGRSPLLSESGTLYAGLSSMTAGGNSLLSVDVSSAEAATSSWPMFGRDIFNTFNAKQYPTVLSAPSITVPATDADGNGIVVSWSATTTPGIDEYVVEESTDDEFTAPVVVYDGGTALTVTLNGRQAGTYYYRVKATKSGYSDSDWREGANGCVVPLLSTASISVAAPPVEGAYRVQWSAVTYPAGVEYILEELQVLPAPLSPEWVEIYRGTDLFKDFIDQPSGTYDYRVKTVKAGYAESLWLEYPGGLVVPVYKPAGITVPALDADGTYTITWEASATPAVVYVLQESLTAGFASAVEVYRGADTSVELVDRAAGTYYYRVKATGLDYTDSAWQISPANSCVVPVRIPTSITVPTTNDIGTFSVTWEASATPGVTYILEESTDENFTPSSTVSYTTGSVASKDFASKQAGMYYYRVKATKPGYTDSDWQVAVNGIFVSSIGSITISDDVMYTKETRVRLWLTCAPYFYQYRLRIDEKKWGPWVTMPSGTMAGLDVSYNLSGADGAKKVSVQFRSRALLYSGVYFDTIVLDRKKPKAVVSQINIASPSTLSLTIDETDDVSGISMMQFSMDNVNWTAWEEFIPTKVLPWQPAAGRKMVFVRIMDGAGNISKTVKVKIPV